MVGKTILVAGQPAQFKKASSLKWVLIGLGVFAFLILAAVIAIGSALGYASHGKIALVKISGTISSSDGFMQSNAGPDEIISMIESAEKDGPNYCPYLSEKN